MVVPETTDQRRGILRAGAFWAPCALGRSGLRHAKREGDGATPIGRFGLARVLYRADRVRRPVTALPTTRLRPDDGWCDDPGDRAYNQPVRLPYRGRHERLWRADHVYDIIVVIDFNTAPARHGFGSAIFLHLARDDFGPTEGCVAIPLAAMLRILPRIGPHTQITIG